jgi:hypothetical protein
MVVVSQVGYLTLDGARYMLARNAAASSLRKSIQPVEIAGIDGLSVNPPLVECQLDGFEHGEGHGHMDGRGQGYRSSLGLEPVTFLRPDASHARLKVGRQLVQVSNQTGRGGVRSLYVDNNLLHVGPETGDRFWTWDGSAGLVNNDVTVNGDGFLTWWKETQSDRLYRTSVSAGGGVYYGVPGSTEASATGDNTRLHYVKVIGTTNRMIYWSNYDAGLTRMLKRDVSGATTTTLIEWNDLRTISQALLGGTGYFWLYNSVNTRQPAGQLWTWDFEAEALVPTPGLILSDNYAVSMCFFKGALYCGLAWGGKIIRVEGNSWESVLHIGESSIPDTAPSGYAIYALCEFDGKLWAAGVDASAPSGQRVWLRYTEDGEAWHLVSTGGNDASESIRAMAPFENTLILGSQEAAAAGLRLYEHSKTLRQTSSKLVMADCEWGAPALLKNFRRTAVQHAPLADPQAVEARYVVDDGAEVSLGTNYDVGSRETAFDLPVGVVGTRLRPMWVLTNDAALDLTLLSGSASMVPAVPDQESWRALLQLSPEMYGSRWTEDDTADTVDVFTKWATLRELQRRRTVFQAVDKFRGDGLPLAFMPAYLDPMVPLEWEQVGLGPFSLEVPVKILQAAQPSNLVPNASFERGSVGSLPTGWATRGAGDSAVIEAPGGSVPDGTRVLKLDFDLVSASYGVEQQLGGLVVGWWYTLSGSVKRDTSAGDVRLEARSASGGGGTLLGATTSLGPQAAEASYARQSIAFQATATTAWVSAVGLNGARGFARFDALQVEPFGPATAFGELGSAA